MEDKNEKIQFDNLEKIFEKLTKEEKESKSAILDISMLPFFSKILESERQKMINIYIPDTIKKLVIMGGKNPQYYFYLTKLISRWTSREVDINYLQKIISMEEKDFNVEFKNVKLLFINDKDIDEIIYYSCIQKISEEEFMVEFSPKFNVLGDVIGKILSASYKLKQPILMLNKRLMIEARNSVAILDAANIAVDIKKDFFEEIIPGLTATRGLRKYIGITIGGAGLLTSSNLPLSAVGFIFAIMDP